MIRSILILFLVLGIGFVVQGQNLLQNGNFTSGNLYWNHYVEAGAAATYSVIDSGYTIGSRCLKAQISALGPNAYNAQSIHDLFPAVRRNTYRLSFKAKCNVSGRQIRVVAQDTNYYANDIAIGNTWQDYQWDFVAGENGLDFKIHWFQLATFYITDIAIVQVPSAPAPYFDDSLKTYASAIGLKLGAAISYSPLVAEAAYARVYDQQYNAMVPENALKMTAIYPNETGSFQFQEADTLATFARTHRKWFRGHTLLWYQGLPSWFTNRTWTRTEMTAFLKNYVNTVVGHYRGQVYEWDVINELFTDGTPSTMRSFSVTNLLGTSIVDSMFIWAHQADTSAKLFYNDYNIETGGSKYQMVYNLVQGMISRGVPIHGVGFQCHFDATSSPAFYSSIERNVQNFGRLGLKVSFTEVDMALRTPIASSAYQTQASGYAQLLRIAFRNPNTVKSILTWGFTDKYSWIPSFWTSMGIPKDDALILDRNYRAKPAYDSLLAALRQQYLLPVSNETQISSFKLLGNPSQGTFMLDGLNHAMSYTVLDVTGKVLESGVLDNEIEFGKKISKAGVYFLLLSDGSRFKLVKE